MKQFHRTVLSTVCVGTLLFGLVVYGSASDSLAGPPSARPTSAGLETCGAMRRLVAQALKPLRSRSGLCSIVVRNTHEPGGPLARAFLAETNMFVHVIGPTPTARDALRRISVTAVTRFAVSQLPAGSSLPYADNLVDVLVMKLRPDDDIANAALVGECRRVLAPGGMLLILPPGSNGSAAATRTFGATGFTDVQEVHDSVQSIITAHKSVPDGMDDWPQFLHGPDNNAVSHDRFIDPPRSVQWTAGPQWSRDHDVTPSVFGLASAGGRIFYVLSQGPISVIDKRLPEKQSLVARDAFNGSLLWKYPLQNWYSSRLIWGHIPASSERRVVASRNRVYLTPGLDAPVVALDAVTGKAVQTYPGTRNTSEIVLDRDVLLLAIRRTSPLEGKIASRNHTRYRLGFPGLATADEALMAVRTDTGAVLWRKKFHARPLTVATSGGCVVFAEEDDVVCVDRGTGNELWRVPGRAETLVLRKDVVVAGAWTAASPGDAAYHPRSRKATLRALSLTNGQVLWTREGDYLPTFMFFRVPMDVFVTADDVVWGVGTDLQWNKKPGAGTLLGFDLRTGAEKVRRDMSDAFTAGHHVRCYKSKATDRYLLFNKRGIEFIRTESGKGSVQVRWARGACRYGIMPANGLIYGPPQACFCYPETQLSGFYAVSAECRPELQTFPDDKRIERGPAQSAPVAAVALSAEDWPMYRHDPRRSGTCPTDVPAKPSVLWTRMLGPGLTPPVVAAGTVYVAQRDSGRLFALSADTGAVLWHFTAGGQIDSPPLVWKDRVLFGCRDGQVYCLQTVDGALAWSFLAARGTRTVAVEGRPESAWPVHGSVLLFKGLVYAAAGRTSEIDGGMDVYALEPETGRVVYHTRLVGPDEQNVRKAGVRILSGRMPGARNDILLTDGTRLYLRHVPLDPSLPAKVPVKAMTWGAKGPKHFLATSGFLDDTFFNRSVWQYGAYVHRSQMLTFDDQAVYGVRVYSGISWNCPIWNIGDGYLLFRRPYRPAQKKLSGPSPKKGNRALFRIPDELFSWRHTVHVLVRGLVRTGRTPESALLFAAGAPERLDPEDPLAAFEQWTEGRILALDVRSGNVRGNIEVPAPPVFDGLIAARGRLLLTLQNGQVLCLGATGVTKNE